MFLQRTVLELENLLHRTSVRVEAHSSTFLLWATIWEKFIVSLLLKNYVIKPDFSHFSVVTFIMPKVSYIKFYSLLLIPPWFYRWLFDCYMRVVRAVCLVHGRLKSFVSFATGSEMWPLPSSPAGLFPVKSFLEPSWALPITFQCLWCSASALLLSLPSLLSVALLSSYWPCQCQPRKAFVKTATAAPHLPLSPTLPSVHFSPVDSQPSLCSLLFCLATLYITWGQGCYYMYVCICLPI